MRNRRRNVGVRFTFQVLHMNPYQYGYPTWPFTKLTPEQMEKLLKDMDKQQRQDALKNAQEALL